MSIEQSIRYNRVLEHYVEDTGDKADLVGLVAYGLYKRQKREWLVAFRSSHDGKDPTEQEMTGLTGAYMTDDLRRTLRATASDMLGDYAQTFVEAIEPRIRQDAISNDALRQARDIESAIAARSGLWTSVWSGIVATALWTLFVAVIAAAVGPEFFRAIATALTNI